jgi:hypothetical protein
MEARMSNLAELSVPEAIEKTLEILLVSDYDLEAIRDEFAYNDSFANSGSAWTEAKYSDPSTVDGLTAKVEATYGGEGMGDEYWMVLSITDGALTRYFRMDGWYASYGNGGELDGDPYEVSPKEKVITVYTK